MQFSHGRIDAYHSRESVRRCSRVEDHRHSYEVIILVLVLAWRWRRCTNAHLCIKRDAKRVDLPSLNEPASRKGKEKGTWGVPRSHVLDQPRLPVLISYYGIIDVGFRTRTIRAYERSGIRRKRLARHADSCRVGSPRLNGIRHRITDCLSSFVLSGKSIYLYNRIVTSISWDWYSDDHTKILI